MKNLTTKLMAAAVAVTLVTCAFAACSAGNTKPSDASKQEAPTAPTESWIEEPPTTVQEVTLGGWEIPEDMTVTADMQSLFDEAVGQLDGYFYYPVMLLGTQVVAGTNYAFLCKDIIKSDSTSSEYIITYVYVDLNGTASFLGDEKIDLPGATGADVAGGWAYSFDATITPEIEKVMATATESLTGATYEPVAYIGSQVVAGTNHVILCKMAPSVEDLGGASSYVLVTVYEDLSGNCEITDTVDIVLEA